MHTSNFISEIGGSAFVAARFNFPQNRVSNWLKNGVPNDIKIRAKFAQLAQEKNVLLPDDFLAGLKL
jgi:hypothetical protein